MIRFEAVDIPCSARFSSSEIIYIKMFFSVLNAHHAIASLVFIC